MFADYMMNAWIAASLAALAAGAVGCFVVLRGASFATHALAMGGFPALAAARLLLLPGWLPVLGLGLCGAVVLSRGEGSAGGRHGGVALWLVLLLATGDLILSRMSGYAGGVVTLLFGEILGISRAEVWATLALVALSLAALAALYRPLLLATLAPDLARVAGLPERGLSIAFLALVAMVASAAMPLVGAPIVFALMLGPASAARGLTRDPLRAVGLSMLLALLTVWISLAAAWQSALPVGTFIGLSSGLWYLLGRLAQGARRSPMAIHRTDRSNI